MTGQQCGRHVALPRRRAARRRRRRVIGRAVAWLASSTGASIIGEFVGAWLGIAPN
ncbi:hypothetical protein [Agromyces sp. GXS1127]|uniref:hypothetical protein n=1 Tax=Agromyces sp. GXS1127 TaxID=3424181 RepID=UPI003D31AF6E